MVFNSIICLILVTLLTTSLGHSHLGSPLPTRRLDCRAGNGRRRDCYGPCPALDTYGQPTGVSPQRPAETWRRGERRSVTWHRNNHGKGESGFVRLSLVPVDQMMRHSAHEKFTFQISCWASGIHRCHSRSVHVCGNDKEGKAYKVSITVPTSYPDGVYALGWAWYGGGDYSGKSFFGDYYSCSFIRIQGGQAVTSSFKPSFVPGLNQDSNSCMSATKRVGVCRREPCNVGKVSPKVPSNLPRSIKSRDIQALTKTNVKTVPRRESRSRRPRRKSNRPIRGRTISREDISIKGMSIYDISTKRSSRVRGSRFSVPTSKYRRGFTLGLNVSGSVSKVVFTYGGKWRTEQKAPYIINGDDSGNLQPLSCRKGQRIRIQAIIYGNDGNKTEKMFRVKCV